MRFQYRQYLAGNYDFVLFRILLMQHFEISMIKLRFAIRRSDRDTAATSFC